MSSIEGDRRAQGDQETIRQIQDYQDRQAQLQDEQSAQRVSDSQSQRVAEQQAQIDAHLQEQQPRQGHASEVDAAGLDGAQKADLQAQIQAQQVGQVNETRELSGIDKADEAVGTAKHQQDRGERWQHFAAEEARRLEELPPSVEAQSRSSDKPDDGRVNIGDLMKQMSIRGGKINA